MGNESSRLKGLIIEKNAIESNDFFALYDATTSKSAPSEEGRHEKVSLFQGEPCHTGPIRLQRAIKNLMIYRHPYILKFIATWEQSGQKHLATERVRPLTSVLSTLSDIQICLGLRTILCALVFLTEKAAARHLNISTSSIYITENGSWRLAGFEYVWKAKEVTKTLLELVKTYRYQPAIDENEMKDPGSVSTIEQYAFATLCAEILSKGVKTIATPGEKIDDCATPHVSEFREYCVTVLNHKNPELRPKLAAVLLHPYFNHEFVLIHSFLFELPLKSLSEKQAFFTGLVDRLRYFNENVVAAQLAADLLSRMVLLDPTAQFCVTPYVLKTKSVDNTAALFSRDTYQRHVMPHIKRMFRLRDAQIRLILLEYFMEYARMMPETELKEFILPHLLLGMNDTNDILVAKTLRCMADLIPLLGAAEVLGGQRTRLFADGRPQAATSADTKAHWIEPRSITPVLTSVGGARNQTGDDDDIDFMVSASPIPDNIDLSESFHSELITQNSSEQQALQQMPPRLSPDGGEDDKSNVLIDGDGEIPLPAFVLTNESTSKVAGQQGSEKVVDTTLDNKSTLFNEDVLANESGTDEVWSDWEGDDEFQRLNVESIDNVAERNTEVLSLPSPAISITNAVKTNRNVGKHICDDLSALDIQVQRIATPPHEKRTEFDFFKDMEPVIKSVKMNVNNISEVRKQNEDYSEIQIDSSRFAAVPSESNGCDATIAFKEDDQDRGDGWDVDEDEHDEMCLQSNDA